MKYLLVIAILFLPRLAAAQDENVDPYVECAELLNSPPLNQLLIQNDGNDYGKINELGKSLLGIECSRDQITNYFLRANWELKMEYEHYSVNGPPDSLFEADWGLIFCKPRKLPWRLFFYRCQATSNFYFFEGRVAHISAGLMI